MKATVQVTHPSGDLLFTVVPWKCLLMHVCIDHFPVCLKCQSMSTSFLSESLQKLLAVASICQDAELVCSGTCAAVFKLKAGLCGP